MINSTYEHKSNIENKTIVDVVQNYFDSEHGLVTLKLHRQPISQKLESDRTYQINSLRMIHSQAEIKVKEFGIPLLQGYALIYLQECENIFKQGWDDNLHSGYQRSNDDLKNPKIKQEPVGDTDTLKYKSDVIVYEQTFEYKYACTSIHAAFSRVKLDADFKLLGATVVSPRIVDFQDVKYNQPLISKDLLVDILTKYGVRIERDKLSDDILQVNWYFDTRVREWKLAYIIKGITNQNDKRVNRKSHQALGEMPFEIVDYIIDATNGSLIDKIHIA
jgi:hypothetical protein